MNINLDFNKLKFRFNLNISKFKKKTHKIHVTKCMCPDSQQKTKF